MTTTAIDYRADPTVAALLRVWEQDKRPPLVLVDALLDLGAEEEAEAVRWAVAVPDRCIYLTDELVGLYPYLTGSKTWLWDSRFVSKEWPIGSADILPRELMFLADQFAPGSLADSSFFRCIDALCAFIDGFVIWDRNGRPE